MQLAKPGVDEVRGNASEQLQVPILEPYIVSQPAEKQNAIHHVDVF